MIITRIRGAAIAALLLPAPLAAPIALATPAVAATCTWHAAELEDEGGPVLTASVCLTDATGAPQLLLQCLGGPHLSYDLGSGAANIEPDTKADFTFRVGGKSIVRQMTLEAMYNYFTLDLEAKNDPLLILLGSGFEVRVESGDYGTRVFPLRGAKAAIGKVLAQCN
ncbi:MAG: hypothetical protein P4M09_29425 [Devosia sp.]|nr:hypothetical protein [Devosia sp.]